MRERRAVRRGAVVAAVCGIVLLIAPATMAQTEPPATTERQDQFWGESSIDPPLESFETVLTATPFELRGVFRLREELRSDWIEQATVRVTDDPEDDFVPSERCPLPAEQLFPGAGPDAEPDDRLVFSTGVDLPCNGRYLIRAVATANREDIPDYEMLRAVVVAVRPPTLTGVAATSERIDGAQHVTVTFDPLEGRGRAIDLLGYRVERAGPDDGSGEYGLFEPIADDLGVDDEAEITDVIDQDGDYRYRVRAVRAGARQEVLSSPTSSPTVDVHAGSTPSTTTTSTGPTGSGRDVDGDGERTTVRTPARTSRAIPTRTRRATAPRTPTTVDTGFDEELDYGDRPVLTVPELADGGELDGQELGSGQSIVRTEDESRGLVAPVAGALVLVGWAGHLVYLNRLAKQF